MTNRTDAQAAINALAAKQGVADSVTPANLANSPFQVLLDGSAMSDESTDSFAVFQDTTEIISGSALTPTFLDDLTVVVPMVGFALDAVTGSVQNTSGGDMARVVGEFSVQVEKTGGGGADTLNIWSESSPDKISWAINSNSLRKVEIPNDGESYHTLSSFVNVWANGDYVRFKMSASSSNISLIPPSITTDLGNVDGLAAFWTMTRVG